jgi:predicted anti-sigma-YlaC factor YlaD
MRELDCESVRMAAMANADGYSALSSNEIEAHTKNCPDCRLEIAQLSALSSLLDTQKRQPQSADTWASIAARLPAESAKQSVSPQRQLFMLLGVLLLSYRLVEIIPDRNLDWLFKLLPIIFVVAVFSYLRENPFKINVELRPEGE